MKYISPSDSQFPLQNQTLITCTFINCCLVDPGAFNTFKSQNKVQTRMLTPAHATAEYLSWGKVYTEKEKLSAPVPQVFPKVKQGKPNSAFSANKKTV